MNQFSASLAQQNACDVVIKVILAGESGAGKSSTLQRFTRNTFPDSTVSTIAVDFQMKKMKIDDKRVDIQVWDTAGQEKYFTITTSYYRQADAVVLICDLTSLESFNKLDKWMDEIRRYARPDAQCIVMGNKSDLQQQRVVSTEQMVQWAQLNHIEYFETSAREGVNVDQAFEQVCRRAVGIKLAKETAFRESAPSSASLPSPDPKALDSRLLDASRSESLGSSMTPSATGSFLLGEDEDPSLNPSAAHTPQARKQRTQHALAAGPSSASAVRLGPNGEPLDATGAPAKGPADASSGCAC